MGRKAIKSRGKQTPWEKAGYASKSTFYRHRRKGKVRRGRRPRVELTPGDAARQRIVQHAAANAAAGLSPQDVIDNTQRKINDAVYRDRAEQALAFVREMVLEKHDDAVVHLTGTAAQFRGVVWALEQAGYGKR